MRKNTPPPKPIPPQPGTGPLENWFRASHRPLPWRKTYDPYHVWLSEVMLQQTQVDTVLPYYERFLRRFPTLADLAGSREGDVLELWSGLGYYSRARNLKAAAEDVVARHGGRLPDSHEELLALPGIGRYMAGAIMSIAFNQPYPIVDGNVRRVLSRIHAWTEPADNDLWRAAEAIARSGDPRVVNQAMMELGATVCTPRGPGCPACPWKSDCRAFRSGRQEEFPAPRKRPATVRVDLIAVIDVNPRGFLMCQKDGLWEFPSFTSLPAGTFTTFGECKHSITHHRVCVQVVGGKLGRRPEYRRVRFDALPVTSLTRKIYSIFEKAVSRT